MGQKRISTICRIFIAISELYSVYTGKPFRALSMVKTGSIYHISGSDIRASVYRCDCHADISPPIDSGSAVRPL